MDEIASRFIALMECDEYLAAEQIWKSVKKGSQIDLLSKAFLLLKMEMSRDTGIFKHGDTMVKPKLVSYMLDSLQHDDLNKLLFVRDSQGRTLLHLAIMTFNEDHLIHILEQLSLEQLVQLSPLQDKSGNTVLHLCLKMRSSTTFSLNLLRRIKRNKISSLVKFLSIRDIQGQTALHIAVDEGCEAVVNEILNVVDAKRRYDLLAMKAMRGYTVLHLKHGHQLTEYTMVDQAEAEGPLNIQKGFTALHHAVLKANIGIISNILETVKESERIKLLAMEDILGNTVMRCAALVPNEQVLTCILDRVSECNRIELLTIQDKLGYTALHWAAMAENIQCVGYMLSVLSPNDRMKLLYTMDLNHRTALHMCAENRNYRLVNFMFSIVDSHHHTDLLSWKTSSGLSVLHLSVSDATGQVFRHALNFIPEHLVLPLLSITDMEGNTVMHLAASAGNKAILKCIVEYLVLDTRYVNLLYIQNKLGRLALHLATENHDCSTVKCILTSVSIHTYFEILGMRDIDGYNVMHWAATRHDENMLRFLLTPLNREQAFKLLSAQATQRDSVLQWAVRFPCTVPDNTVLQPHALQETLTNIASNQEQAIAKCILDSVCTQRHFELLAMADIDGCTALHWAAGALDYKTVCCLLNCLASIPNVCNIALPPQREQTCSSLDGDAYLKLLTKQDRKGHTALHLAVTGQGEMAGRGRDVEMLMKRFLEPLRENQRFKLLEVQDEKGNTALHTAVSLGYYSTSMIILGSVSVDHQSVLLSLRNSNEKTALHIAIEKNRSHTVKHILSHTNRHQLIKLLDEVDLHSTVSDPGLPTLKVILEFLGKDNCFSLLAKQNHFGNTVLHCASNERTLNGVFKYVDVDTRMQLLTLRNNKGNTILQEVMSLDNETMIGCILDSVDDKQFAELLCLSKSLLLSLDDEAYSTVSKCAAARNLSVMLVKLVLDSVELEEGSRLAISAKYGNRGKTVSDVLGSVPLSLDDINLIYPSCLQYPIANNQQKTQRHGIVLFNTEDREGCEDEADRLLINLTMAGYTTKRVKWSNTMQLMDLLIETVQDVSKRCSMLFISIMSHGTEGMLRGSDGSKVPVNDVLFQFKQHLPEPIPLLCLIQACRTFELNLPDKNHDMANRGASTEECKYVVLERPHTALLLSTITNGKAKRGAFTGAMGEEISQADGETDIHTMFNNAVRKMECKDSDCSQQIPEFRSTLRKPLIHPESTYCYKPRTSKPVEKQNLK